VTTIRLLGPGEAAVLDRVAEGVFDNPVGPRWAAEFFADPRHHLAVALDGGVVIGMASAVHYVHPDKPPQLWVNEVGSRRTRTAASAARCSSPCSLAAGSWGARRRGWAPSRTTPRRGGSTSRWAVKRNRW
jgi:hypothetical protein